MDSNILALLALSSSGISLSSPALSLLLNLFFSSMAVLEAAANDQKQKDFDENLLIKVNKMEILLPDWESRLRSVEQRRGFDELLSIYKKARESYADEVLEEKRTMFRDIAADFFNCQIEFDEAEEMISTLSQMTLTEFQVLKVFMNNPDGGRYNLAGYIADYQLSIEKLVRLTKVEKIRTEDYIAHNRFCRKLVNKGLLLDAGEINNDSRTDYRYQIYAVSPFGKKFFKYIESS